MGRSKLRGIEMAGVRLAIEVPSNLPWEWPDERLQALSCVPADADVHIGVRVAIPAAPTGETFRYESHGVRFEIGWEGESFAVAVYGKHGLERTARFDPDFRHGEITMCPSCATAGSYPLEHPLDELVMLHRLTREGCVIVNGSVSLEGREALLFLESSRNRRPEVPGNSFESVINTHFVLCPVLENGAVSDTRVWVYSTPWRQGRIRPVFERAPLRAVHVLCDDAERPVERLSLRASENEILQHVFAPLHDPDAACRLTEIVGRVARRTRVLLLDKPRMDREISFNWDLPQASLGFAPPSS